MLIVNKDQGELSVDLPLSLFGLPTSAASAVRYSCRDIWTREDLDPISVGGKLANQTWAVRKVPSHDSVFVKFTPEGGPLLGSDANLLV